MGTITKSDKLSINKALKWLKENSKVNKEGNIAYNIDYPYYAAKELLISLTTGKINVPERTHRRLVNKAFTRWMKYKKYQNQSDPCDAFVEALEVEKRKLLKKKQEFEVVLFLNVDREYLNDIEPITVLDSKIEIRQWSDFEHLFGEPEWKRLWYQDRTNPIFYSSKSDKPRPSYSKFTPVSININTFGTGAALTIASDRLDIFRSIINISAVIGKFVLFRSRPKHLSVVLPSPIYLIYKDNELVNLSISTDRYKYKKAKLKEKHKKNIQYFSSLFKKTVSEKYTTHHILSILRLYQDAIDSSQPRPAYLSMWQVVESSVTFPNEVIDQKKVISRVSNLIEVDPLYRSTLDLLKNIRNTLVHSGDFLDQSDDLFFTLKLIADQCIIGLINLSSDYNTISKLKNYFIYKTMNKSDLDTIETVIQIIKKNREKKSK